MKAIYISCGLPLRLLLVSPFACLLAASFILYVAAVFAYGAGALVRYPDSLPVLAGFIAATPSAMFALVAGRIVWQKSSRRLRLDTRGLAWGLVPIVLAIALLLIYALSVGDPAHYKGQFNLFTQQWDPRFEAAAYIWLIVGVSAVIPMGGFGVATKLLYLDAIQTAKLDQPEGYDPVGIMLRTQGPAHR